MAFSSKPSSSALGRGARSGRFVTLLSDDRPPIKDAFAWIKLLCKGKSVKVATYVSPNMSNRFSDICLRVLDLLGD